MARYNFYKYFFESFENKSCWKICFSTTSVYALARKQPLEEALTNNKLIIIIIIIIRNSELIVDYWKQQIYKTCNDTNWIALINAFLNFWHNFYIFHFRLVVWGNRWLYGFFRADRYIYHNIWASTVTFKMSKKQE